MARAPSIRNILLADLQKEDGDERLARALTQFMEPVASALERGLTFEENVVCQWHDAEITYPDRWTTLTLLNTGTFSNLGADSVAQYRRVGGQVELRGYVVATGAGICFNLPVHARPPRTAQFPVACASGAAGYLGVDGVNGNCNYAGGATAWFNVDPVRFSVAAADSSSATPVYEFKCALPSRPKAVFVAECRNTADAVTQSGPCSWVYTQNNQGSYIRINEIPGLMTGKKYAVRFLVIWK